jgi:DNA-binding NarL/FixJ family response regulator
MRNRTHWHASDEELLQLWRQGKNSNEIARAMWSQESDIANRLPEILQRARQDQEWDFDRTA